MAFGKMKKNRGFAPANRYILIAMNKSCALISAVLLSRNSLFCGFKSGDRYTETSSKFGILSSLRCTFTAAHLMMNTFAKALSSIFILAGVALAASESEVSEAGMFSNAFVSTYQPGSEISGLQDFDILKQAESLFQWNLYQEALPIYQETLKISQIASREDLSRKIQLRIALCHVLMGDYLRSNAILSGLVQAILPTQFFDPTIENGYILYLKSFTDRALGRYSQATDTLNELLNKISDRNQRIRELLQLELSLNMCASKEYAKATPLLQTISEGTKERKIAHLAQLQLARIELIQNIKDSAKKRLDRLEISAVQYPELYEQLIYLRGYASFRLNQNREAVKYFEELLRLSSSNFHANRLELQLAEIYLALIEEKNQSESDRKLYLKKAEKLFQSLHQKEQSESDRLLFARFLISVAHYWDDENALKQANKILGQPGFYSSENNRALALILRSQASKDYREKCRILQSLVNTPDFSSTNQAMGWYYLGTHHYNEACRLKDGEKASSTLNQAAASFEMAYDLFKENRHILLVQTKNNLFHVYTMLKDAAFMKQAHLKLQEIITESTQDEELSVCYYISALVALKLNEVNSDLQLVNEAENRLIRIRNNYPKSSIADHSLKLLGSLYFMKSDYEESRKIFLDLVQTYPKSSLIAEALYWSARSLEEIGGSVGQAKDVYQKIYREFSTSEFAPEAYFRCYSCQDYLQGDREPIKHLQGFEEQFQNSPYLMNALFMLGLDAKKDRRNPEGKWISKKNLSKAIDYFYKVEQTFERLLKDNIITKDQLITYQQLNLRAKLERAMANLAIAEESQTTKKRIYLEYAEDLFVEILKPYKNGTNFLAQQSQKIEDYSDIIEESYAGLGETYRKAGNGEAAKAVYYEMIEKYRESKTTRGYYLSRAWYHLGLIEMDSGNYSAALSNFQQAEEAAKGRIITTDQKLELWMQASECCKRLNELDRAMSLLSKVINEDAVSGLRLKAMYLRSEIYELQERYELAKRQLEATANKGGEWGKKAKEKLGKDYGNR